MNSAHLRIQKYGGTSVGDSSRIQAIARHLTKLHEEGDQLVVVVSAMGQTTDELHRLAKQMSSNPPHREMDMLLTAGERISMALLSIALHKLGVEAVSLTGSQAGILTCNQHRNARIKKILGNRIREGLKQNKVVIVAGFQGVSPDKEVTTLGRGGSDTTAVALSVALGSHRCEIYTDVDAIYTAPPSLVSNVRPLSRLTYRQALALAESGARVLHPRSVELAEKHQISIWLGNSLKLGQAMGTEISQELEQLESSEVLGINSDLDRFPVEISLSRGSLFGSVLASLSEKNLQLKWVQFSENKIYGLIEVLEFEDWKVRLEYLSAEGYLSGFKFKDEYRAVSVVVSGSVHGSEHLEKSLEALGSRHVFPNRAYSETQCLNFIVLKSQVEETIQILHRHWIEEK